jgi:hypothetical protein
MEYDMALLMNKKAQITKIIKAEMIIPHLFITLKVNDGKCN